MDRKLTSTQQLARLRAFSLIEVVISIGIVSFAMVALVGMLPVGLNTFRRAINTTVESQIVQGITSDLQLTDYTKLPATAVVNYYDEQGMLLSGSGTAVLYTITVSPKALQVGSTTLTPAKTMQIQICNKAASPRTTNYYSVIVVDNNQ